jgi:hypothetical protein
LIEFNLEKEKSKNYLMLIGKNTSQVIVGSKNVSRKRKINKIFNLGLDIKDGFSPSKSITSRYSGVQISNPYKSFFIEDNDLLLEVPVTEFFFLSANQDLKS